MLIAKLALLGVTLAAADAHNVPRQVTVAVGASASLGLQTPGALHLCDDPSVVRIDASSDGKSWVATGLKEGHTRCSFAENAKAQRILLDLVVTAAPTEPAAPKHE